MDDSLSSQKWDRVPLQNLLWSYSNIKTPWQHIVYLFSCLSQWSGLSLCCIKSPAYQQKKTDSGVPIEALSIYMTHTILLLAIIVQEMHSVINTSQDSLARAFKTDLWLTVFIIIIWQAPQAGSMRRILCSDWLPERARWSDTARPGLPVSFPQIKFRQSSSERTKVFSRWNYFLLR